MIVDYRKLQRGGHSHMYINGAEVERASSESQHLTDDLTWSLHTKVVRSAHQHLFFLRRLRKFGLPPDILTNFYICTIESILIATSTSHEEWRTPVRDQMFRGREVIGSTRRSKPITKLQLLRMLHDITEWVKMMSLEVILPASSRYQPELEKQKGTEQREHAELILEDLEDIAVLSSSMDECSTPCAKGSSLSNGHCISFDGTSVRNRAPSDVSMSHHRGDEASPDKASTRQALITAESIFTAVVQMIGSLSGNTEAARFILEPSSEMRTGLLKKQLKKFIMPGSVLPFTKHLTNRVYDLLWNTNAWTTRSARHCSSYFIPKNVAARGDWQWEFFADVSSTFADEAIPKLLQSYLKVTRAAQGLTSVSDDEKEAMDRLCETVTSTVKDRIAVTCGHPPRRTAKAGQPGPQLSDLSDTTLEDFCSVHEENASPVAQEHRQSFPVMKAEPNYLPEDTRQFRTVPPRVLQRISAELVRRLESTCCTDLSGICDPLVSQLSKELEDLPGIKVSCEILGGRLLAPESNAVSAIVSEAHDSLVRKYWLMEVLRFDQWTICSISSTIIEAITRYAMIDMKPSRPSPVFDVYNTGTRPFTSVSSELHEEDISNSGQNSGTWKPIWQAESAFTTDGWSTSCSTVSSFSPSEIREIWGDSNLNNDEDCETPKASKCSSGGRPGTFLIAHGGSIQEDLNDLSSLSTIHLPEEKHMDIAACSD
ncbi:hypothetical protein NFI96_007356, partial [Prochilodus magdalenae]